MERATVTLNERGQQRALVLNRVERGVLTGEAVARLRGLPLPQARILLAAHRKGGVAAMANSP